MKKKLILGKGYLGQRISNELGYFLSDFRVEDYLSLEKYLDYEKPDLVINTIAKTGNPNTDWCESHKEETAFSNVTIPSFLKEYCFKRGIYLIHFGTGGMYEGDNFGKGFTEEDEPEFSNSQFYVKTKILAEKILKDYSSCLQLRINLPIDNLSHKKNLIDKLKTYKKLLRVPNSITSVPHALLALEKLIYMRETGVYNLVNPGTISMAEIMEDYRKIVCPSHEFEEFSIEDLNKITSGKRMNCFLNTSKLQSKGIFIPEVHSAVKECLEQYKKRI